MPICKMCSQHFPNWQEVAGRRRNLQRRKYCLTCSPFGKHNTRRPEFDKQSQLLRCNGCGRKYIYDHSKGPGRTICNSCQVNTRRFEVKLKAIEYKGGACSSCGYNRCTEALVFHHNVPEEKEFALSGKHSLSWTRLQQELDKCDLLCMNCHAELHSRIRHVAQLTKEMIYKQVN